MNHVSKVYLQNVKLKGQIINRSHQDIVPLNDRKPVLDYLPREFPIHLFPLQFADFFLRSQKMIPLYFPDF